MTTQMTQGKKDSSKTHKTPNFKPLGNRVLVRRLEEQEKLKGGIILPDTAKKKQELRKWSLLGQGKKIKTEI